MTDTLDIVRAVLKGKWKLEILEALCDSDLTFSNLMKSLGVKHTNQVARPIKDLDRLALVEHVFTKKGDFYRISARGKRILFIIKGVANEELINTPC